MSEVAMNLFVLGSLVLLVSTVYLLKKRYLRDSFAVMWLAFSIILTLFALFSNQIISLILLLKRDTGAGAGVVLFTVFAMVVGVQLYLSIWISKINAQQRRLSQTLGCGNVIKIKLKGK